MGREGRGVTIVRSQEKRKLLGNRSWGGNGWGGPISGRSHWEGKKEKGTQQKEGSKNNEEIQYYPWVRENSDHGAGEPT